MRYRTRIPALLVAAGLTLTLAGTAAAQGALFGIGGPSAKDLAAAVEKAELDGATLQDARVLVSPACTKVAEEFEGWFLEDEITPPHELARTLAAGGPVYPNPDGDTVRQIFPYSNHEQWSFAAAATQVHIPVDYAQLSGREDYEDIFWLLTRAAVIAETEDFQGRIAGCAEAKRTLARNLREWSALPGFEQALTDWQSD